MNKVTNFLYSIFISISIIILFINFTLRFKELYYFDIDYLDIESISNLSKEEIILNYDYLIDYNLGYEKEFHMPTIKYSEEGKIHFEEVRDIFIRLRQLFVVCSFIGIIAIYKNIKEKNINLIKYVSLSLFLLPIILFIPIVFNFEKSFVIFHKIFFRNDYWIFDPDLDPVINILPAEFFLHCGIMILLLIFLSSILLYTIYKLSKNRINKN